MSETGGDGTVGRKFQQGPIVHPVLSEDFIARVKAFKAILAEVETVPLDRALDGFRRDHHPERELAIWEKLAKVYQAAMAQFGEIALAQKKAVLGLLLSLSIGDNDLEKHAPLAFDKVVWVAEEYLGRHAGPG